MFSLIPVVLSSLVVCLVITPFLRDFFGFLGFVDKPDSFRKMHARPIPRRRRHGARGGVLRSFPGSSAGLEGWVSSTPTTPRCG